MIETVGNYVVELQETYTIIKPLSSRCKLKYEEFYFSHDSRIPKYVREFIERKRMYSGWVYLIHFDKKIADHAQHYIGFAKNVESRMIRHNAGRGSALMREVNRLDIDYTVVRLWYGDRYLERRLKRQRNHKRFCPICTPKLALDAASGFC